MAESLPKRRCLQSSLLDFLPSLVKPSPQKCHSDKAGQSQPLRSSEPPQEYISCDKGGESSQHAMSSFPISETPMEVIFSPWPSQPQMQLACPPVQPSTSLLTSAALLHDQATTISQLSEGQNSQLPDCWSIQQWAYFKKQYVWLFLNSGNIGCSLCREARAAGGLSVYKGSQGLRLSPEWAEGKVGPSGTEKAFRQKQIRKKIKEHNDSLAHAAAGEVLKERQEHRVEGAQQKGIAAHLETTSRVFQTAYFLAKNNRPFTDHPKLIELHEVTGSNMGRVLHSNVIAADIITHIASHMQKKIVLYIVQHKPKISVFVDESTTVSNKSTLIIYLRGVFGALSKPVTIFFGLLELQETNALAIKSALLAYLENVGLSRSLLQEIWIAVCSDGAAVMFGKKGGVTALLRAEFPNLVLSWHCLAHRLELAVADTVDEVAGANHFKIFMDALYCTYSMSPKNVRQLEMAAADVGVQLRKIGKMLDTRWVASSARAVEAVWQCFPALCKHFEEASKDTSRSGQERSKYEGLLKKLVSFSFVKDLGLMYDALQELKGLSESLQKRDITILHAHRLLRSQVQVFEAMKDTPGEFACEAAKCIEERMFKGIPINEGRVNSVSLNEKQFYQSLSVNIAKRCAPESDNVFLATFEVLDASNIPDGQKSVLYGEPEVKRLCTMFQLPSTPTMQAFRVFKDFRGRRCPEALRTLLACMETLPASNADCERGFSSMNLIASPTRSSILIGTISACLWVKLNGPPLTKFEPVPYVKSWLAKGRRSADERRCAQRQKALDENEQYYQGFWELLK